MGYSLFTCLLMVRFLSVATHVRYLRTEILDNKVSEDCMRLENKVALISGAARGIGAAVTKIFAREGAKLVIGDILEDEGRRTAEEVTAAGGACYFVRLDVVSEADWIKAVGEVITRFVFTG